jgi:hypothetical protein
MIYNPLKLHYQDEYLSFLAHRHRYIKEE